MRIAIIALVTSFVFVCAANASAQPARQQFTVTTPAGSVVVEGFRNCASATCPAVVILSGSRGFGASVYDEIGQTFQAARLNAYLVHVLSPADLDAIATAGSPRARIAYYVQRLPDWTTAVQGVVSHLKAQPRHAGKVAVLGISLGAQIALAASVGKGDVDALVLVDGGFPKNYAQPVRSLPPLHLIWGSADQTFPLSIGQDLQRMAQRLGRPASLDVYEGGAHDFFLKSGTRQASAAHQSAADFLESQLSR